MRIGARMPKFAIGCDGSEDDVKQTGSGPLSSREERLKAPKTA